MYSEHHSSSTGKGRVWILLLNRRNERSSARICDLWVNAGGVCKAVKSLTMR